MGKLVQVRDVPDEVHRRLKVRAAQAGISLSELLRAELALIVSRPSPEEVLERLRRMPRLSVPANLRPAAIIRKARGPLR